MPGCGSAWLERLVWDQEVAGSNPVTPIQLNNFSILIMREWLRGGAPPCQGGGRGFESRLALLFFIPVMPGFFCVLIDFQYNCSIMVL